MPAQTKPQKAAALSPWESALAGAAGAVVANALVYPLDIVKTRLQVQTYPRPQRHGGGGAAAASSLSSSSKGHDGDHNDDADADDDDLDEDDDKEQDAPYTSTADAVQRIVAEDGLAGLYRGMAGALIGVASTNFAYFYWYSVVRTLYVSTTTTTTAAAAAAAAAATTTTISRKLQQSPQPWRDGQWRNGQWQQQRNSSTLLAPPPPPQQPQQPQQPALDTGAELALGALAGALAQLFTIPVSVVTTRQQTQRRRADKKGLLATAREVVRDGDDGVRALWRGLSASLVLVANPAITYAAYQRLRQVLFPPPPPPPPTFPAASAGAAAKARRLRPWEAFALGALSKAIATIITQPLIVAKVALQSRPPPPPSLPSPPSPLPDDSSRQQQQQRRRQRRQQQQQQRPHPRGFVEVLRYIVRHEGARGLFKGLGPQLLKGLLVQGLLMMTKERMEIFMLLLLRYLRGVRMLLLIKMADKMADKK